MPVSSGFRSKNNPSNLSTPDTNPTAVKSPTSESVSKWKIPHYYKRSSSLSSSGAHSSRGNNNRNSSGVAASTGNVLGSSGFGNQGPSSSNMVPRKLIIEEVKGRLPKARRNGKEMVFVNYTVQDDTSATHNNGVDDNSGSSKRGTSVSSGTGGAFSGADINIQNSGDISTVNGTTVPSSLEPKPPVFANYGHVSSQKPTRGKMLKIFNSSRSGSTSHTSTVPNSAVPASVEYLTSTPTYMNRSISTPNLITEEMVMPTMKSVKSKKSHSNMSLKYASRVRKSSVPKNSRSQGKQSTTPPSAPTSTSESVYTTGSPYFNLGPVNPDVTLSPLSQQQRNDYDGSYNINMDRNTNGSGSSGFLNDTVVVEERVEPTPNNPTYMSFGTADANYVNLSQLSNSPMIASFQHNPQNSDVGGNGNNLAVNTQDINHMGPDFSDKLSFTAASHVPGNSNVTPLLNNNICPQAQAQAYSYWPMHSAYCNSTGDIASTNPQITFPEQQQQVRLGGSQNETPTIMEGKQLMTSDDGSKGKNKDNDASVAFSKMFAMSKSVSAGRHSMYSQRSLSATNVASGSAAPSLSVKKTRRRPTSISAASGGYSHGNIKSPTRNKLASRSASSYRVGLLSIVPDVPEPDMATSIVTSMDNDASANIIAAANFLDSQTVTSSRNGSAGKGMRSKQPSISELYSYQLPGGNSGMISVDSAIGVNPQLSTLATPVLDNSAASQAYFHPLGSATMSNSVTSTPSIVDFNNNINNCINLSLSSIHSQSTGVDSKEDIHNGIPDNKVNSNFNFNVVPNAVPDVYVGVPSDLDSTNPQHNQSVPGAPDIPVLPLRRSSLTSTMSTQHQQLHRDNFNHHSPGSSISVRPGTGRNPAEVFSYKNNQSDSTLVISSANQNNMNRAINSSEFPDAGNAIRFVPQMNFVSNIATVSGARSRNGSSKGNSDGNRNINGKNFALGAGGALFINTNCNDYRDTAVKNPAQIQTGTTNNLGGDERSETVTNTHKSAGSNSHADTGKLGDEEESLIQQMYQEFNFENPNSFFHEQSKLLNLDIGIEPENVDLNYVDQERDIQVPNSGNNHPAASTSEPNDGRNHFNISNDANLDYSILTTSLASGQTEYPLQNFGYANRQPDIGRNG